MVSKKAIGDKTEREVEAILKKQGCITMKSPRTMKRVFIPGRKMIYVSQDNDFFNLFDIVAKETCYTRWIQVKYSSQANASTSRKEIKEFCEQWGNESDIFEVWLRIPKKGFVVWSMSFRDTDLWYKTFKNIQGEACEPFIIKETKK